MFDLIVMTLILLVIAIAEAFVIWSYARDNRDLTRQLAKFDHDGDGRVGGSLKR